jgi:hypothetical protein
MYTYTFRSNLPKKDNLSENTTTNTNAPSETKQAEQQVPTKPTAAQVLLGQAPSQQQTKKSTTTQETVKPTSTPTTTTTASGSTTSPVSYSRAVASGNTPATNQQYNKTTWKPKDSPPTSASNTPAPVAHAPSTTTSTPTTPATTTTSPSAASPIVNTTSSNNATQAQTVATPVAQVNNTPVASTTTPTTTANTTTTPTSTTTSSADKSSHHAYLSSPVTLPAKATVVPLDSHFSEFHFGSLNISNSEFDPHYNATPSTSDKHVYGKLTFLLYDYLIFLKILVEVLKYTVEPQVLVLMQTLAILELHLEQLVLQEIFHLEHLTCMEVHSYLLLCIILLPMQQILQIIL